jgi:threonine dehydratase
MRDKMDFQKHVLRTPLIPYRADELSLKERIFLKPENLQIFGSYKIRGVVSVVDSADPHALKKGLVTASAGNMAQAVAFVARELRIPCRIYVPESAPEAKKSVIRGLGAEMIEKPFAEIWEIVQRGSVVGEEGIFIHPAFTEALVTGYGSIVDEVIEDLPDFDAMVVPFGVGGLSLGITRRIKSRHPSASIFVAEPETAAPMRFSLAQKKASAVERRSSFIDAIGTPEVLRPVFEELSPVIAGSIVVQVKEAEAAVSKLFRSHRIVVEGAAACSLAAAERLARESESKKIVCLLSGGNIDIQVFGELMSLT